jgi:hypothetical protein
MSDQIKTVDNQKFSFRPVLFFIRVQSPTLIFIMANLTTIFIYPVIIHSLFRTRTLFNTYLHTFEYHNCSVVT